jgi:hypothetical protein
MAKDELVTKQESHQLEQHVLLTAKNFIEHSRVTIYLQDHANSKEDNQILAYPRLANFRKL